MARSGRPWAVVVAAIVSALVAAGALVAAAVLRAERSDAASQTTEQSPPTTTSTVGANGCLIAPCTIPGLVRVGGATIDLVIDSGGTSGRLRVGDGAATYVIELTMTDSGVTLTNEPPTCVAGTLTVCVVRGTLQGAVLAQVIVGRSGKWHSLQKPIASDAGYLGVADVMGAYTGAEIVAAKHRCDRTKTADCSQTQVFLQVYSNSGELVGCSRYYARLESLPGWPNANLSEINFDQCA